MPAQTCAGFVERLAIHVHPRPTEKVFCMLEAYMDESGIHDGAHTCVIAGYWGGEGRWREFEDRWSQVIKDANEPTMKEFHSVEFWKSDGTRRGIFAQWSDSKANRFIDDLLTCITDHAIYPTSATMKVSAWKQLTKNERRFLTGGKFDIARQVWVTPSAPNRTYYFPFQFVVTNATSACKDGLKVHYVFDIHKQFKNHATDLYALLRKNQNLSCRKKLGEFAMADSVDAPGLQAADLFAYQTYQHNRLRIESPTPIKTSTLPKILRRAIANNRGDSYHLFIEENGLEASLEPLPMNVRKSAEEFPIKLMRH